MDKNKCYNTNGASINGIAIRGLNGVSIKTNVELENNDLNAGTDSEENQALGR